MTVIRRIAPTSGIRNAAAREVPTTVVRTRKTRKEAREALLLSMQGGAFVKTPRGGGKSVSN
jgi:hypothetical protein